MLNDWGVVIAISGQLITWLGVVVAFSIAWGKLIQRVETVEVRIGRIDGEIHDPAQKLLTEARHAEICANRQELVFLRLEHICKKLEERKSLDSDFYQRIRSIETAITEMSTELKIGKNAA